MRARLKSLDCDAITVPLAQWNPDATDFGLSLRAMIGPADGEGVESFTITVCTPGWLAAQMCDGDMRAGTHTIFVKSYNYPALLRFIERAVQRVEAPTWRELAAKLDFLGHWEFAKYD